MTVIKKDAEFNRVRTITENKWRMNKNHNVTTRPYTAYNG